MLDVVATGLITGWAIAVPIGAVGAALLVMSSRLPWRVAAGAALGIATVDLVYAGIAVAGGSTVASALSPVARPLQLVAAGVLVAVAAVVAWDAVHPGSEEAVVSGLTAKRAYVGFVALTAVNPATVLYFVAFVLGNHDLTDTAPKGVVFVLAVAAASASWQLLLAGVGRMASRALAGPRARTWTGLLAACVILALAAHTAW